MIEGVECPIARDRQLEDLVCSAIEDLDRKSVVGCAPKEPDLDTVSRPMGELPARVFV